jgi:hypothetical protein
MEFHRVCFTNPPRCGKRLEKLDYGLVVAWIVVWHTGQMAQGRKPGTTLWRGLLEA